ncbi:MAG: hypothetical protein IKK71_01085 [Clostridia bacterium]|nr:hypothetical protein [Clostridia bacterium]
MKKIKQLFAIVLVLSLIFTFAACGSEKPRKIGKYTSKIVQNTVESSIVAENDNFAMRWDNEKSCVLIENKESGYVWSTIPNDYYNGKEAGPRAETLFNSPIIVTYVASPNNSLKTINGSSVFEEGMITAKKVKNGIQLGYFFDNVEISIPVIYKLYDDHFTVTVEPAGILENNNKVYQVEIAPFLTAIPASKDKDDYMLVPSGSGALMYSDERDGIERVFKEAVYGEDLSAFKDHISKNTYKSSLPVFGVNRGDKALFAIIENGAASCEITASAGDPTVGYSNVCAAFSVRGQSTEVVKLAQYGASRVNTYSDGLINEKCTVAFYPLEGDDAGYSGMAECYRNYLSKKYKIDKKNADSPLYLQVLGGALTDESFVGVPYKQLQVATTIDQAADIVKDVIEATGLKPTVQLKGFGKSGLDVGKVGGGFKLDSKYGSWKDVKSLKELCEVYFDFDIVKFDTSGKGFMTISNSAKAENGSTAYQYYFDIAAGNRVEEKGRYRLLKRASLSKALNKALDAVEGKDLTGISLSTLGTLAYSDYASPKYYAKGNLDAEISQMLMKAKGKTSIMTSNANAYAAANSSHIIATPSANSGYSSLDAQVPFYRMVFKGIASISTEAINTSVNPKTELLKAAETGCGLLYAVSAEYNSKFRLSDSSLALSVYSDNKESIIADCKQIGDLLSKVSNTSIEQHTILSKGVNKTEFENGVTVIVNYTNKAVKTPLGVVEAQGFVYQ